MSVLLLLLLLLLLVNLTPIDPARRPQQLLRKWQIGCITIVVFLCPPLLLLLLL
jgi:hypothetical protein